jgi:CheY-like chemotaxis protein
MKPPEHGRTTNELAVLFVGTPRIDLETSVQSSCSCPVAVDVVIDGQEAIRWLSNASKPTTDRGVPDMILLEFGGEPPDGETVLHAIKSSPRLETVPTVVLTAEESDAETAYDYGGNAHVTIPNSAEAYAELARSIGQFWFEWAQYPSESLFTDKA